MTSKRDKKELNVEPKKEICQYLRDKKQVDKLTQDKLRKIFAKKFETKIGKSTLSRMLNDSNTNQTIQA